MKKIKIVTGFLKEFFRPAFRLVNLWIYLPGIAGILLVYLADAKKWEQVLSKPNHETLAIILMSLTTVIMIIGIFRDKGILIKIFLALAVSFLCREIHFAGTGKGIYIALVIIIAWSCIRREEVLKDLKGRAFLHACLLGTAFSYFLSQTIARRVWRDIFPFEDKVHVPLEEMTENVAHIFLLITALILVFRKVKHHQTGAEALKK